MTYDEFIKSKAARYAGAGIEINTSDVHPLLMPFQRDIVR